jgi:hypothetical protein
MHARNLAVVFAPSLLRSQDESIEVVLHHSSHAQKLIMSFILHYDFLFKVRSDMAAVVFFV